MTVVDGGEGTESMWRKMENVKYPDILNFHLNRKGPITVTGIATPRNMPLVIFPASGAVRSEKSKTRFEMNEILKFTLWVYFENPINKSFFSYFGTTGPFSNESQHICYYFKSLNFSKFLCVCVRWGLRFRRTFKNLSFILASTID